MTVPHYAVYGSPRSWDASEKGHPFVKLRQRDWVAIRLSCEEILRYAKLRSRFHVRTGCSRTAWCLLTLQVKFPRFVTMQPVWSASDAANDAAAGFRQIRARKMLYKPCWSVERGSPTYHRVSAPFPLSIRALIQINMESLDALRKNARTPGGSYPWCGGCLGAEAAGGCQ
jgi:hypothetical protein